MPQTNWPRSEEWNVALQNERLRREMWKKLFFSRFVGFTSQNETENGFNIKAPSGMPIEVLREFATEGSDHMLIPMILRIKGAGIYGDNQLKGNEERQNLYYQKAYINQIRNALKSGGRMSQQRMKKLDLIRRFRPQLEDWLAEWMEYNFLYTFHHGYSPHILATVPNGGINLTSGQKIPHPNFYAAGSGFVTWNATPATYEASVEDAVTGVTDTSSDYFSTTLLEDLRVRVQEKNIKPMVTQEGIQFYPMVVHPLQMKQIRAESDWKAAQRDWASGMQGVKNPIFNGASGFYAGFVLYERELTMAVDPDNVAGTVAFGWPTAEFGEAALSDHARKVAIIFGAGAIAHGDAMGPYIDEDDEDYKNLKGVAIGLIGGSARSEYKDNSTDGSNTAVINQSSITVCTYSA